MPTGTLSGEGKKLWEKIYNDSKSKGDSEEIAARKAWAGIKSAGWHKDKDGKWVKSSFAEFSMVLKDISYNKTEEKMRWKADASDIDTDSHDDSMSLELFADFLARIESKEKPPEEFCSEFWQGGLPYLSISHYSDFNGDGVPGDVEKVYVDGKFLKSAGTFYNTKLGKACFRALYDELNWTPKSEQDKKDHVRVSIGFLDYGHKHKSDGTIFERKSIDDVCPRCIEEIIMSLMDDNYQRCGKIYLKGHLIHEALTRVPVNKRTIMEVDRSEAGMVTQKEDAASIIGEELADELEEKAKLTEKSEALVTRADKTCPDGEKMVDGKCVKCDKEGNPIMGKSDFAPVSTDAVPVTVVDPVQIFEPSISYGGATSLKDALAYMEAQQKMWSIDDLWYTVKNLIDNIVSSDSITDKASAINSLIDEFKGEMKSKADFTGFITEMKAYIDGKFVSPVLTSTATHPLDDVFSTFKVQFDAVISTSATSDEKLVALQEGYVQIGNKIKELVAPKKTEVTEPPANDLVSALREVMQSFTQQLSLISTQLSDMKQVQDNQPRSVVIPKRKGIDPASVVQPQLAQTIKSETPHLRAMLERNVEKARLIK